MLRAPLTKQFSIVHEFACTEARFWQIFFDPAYVEVLFRDGLKVAYVEVLAHTETEAEVRRKLSGRPQLKLPAAAQKMVGDRLGFTEEGRFERKAPAEEQDLSGRWRAPRRPPAHRTL